MNAMRLQGLVWSAFWARGVVYVCLRSRVDSVGVVRELSEEAATDIGQNPRAFELLVAELEGELCERAAGMCWHW